jgi:hypothetical protein
MCYLLPGLIRGEGRMSATFDLIVLGLQFGNTQWLVVATGCLMGAMLLWLQPE